MPISYNIDHEKRRIYSRATGVITYDDLLAHMRADVGDDVSSYSELLDCTAATSSLTANEIRKLADERKAIALRHPPGPVALVATSDVFFGMLRIFDMLTDEVRPIRVFRTLSQAEIWLDEQS